SAVGKIGRDEFDMASDRTETTRANAVVGRPGPACHGNHAVPATHVIESQVQTNETGNAGKDDGRHHAHTNTTGGSSSERASLSAGSCKIEAQFATTDGPGPRPLNAFQTPGGIGTSA